MREELVKLSGLRRTFKGTFVRFGLKSGYMNVEKTVLLKDIIEEATGKVVTDHLWFSLGKRLALLNLQEGDVVSFDARVTKYVKGYRGRREDVDKPVMVDYRLSHPTKLVMLKKTVSMPLSVPRLEIMGSNPSVPLSMSSKQANLSQWL